MIFLILFSSLSWSCPQFGELYNKMEGNWFGVGFKKSLLTQKQVSVTNHSRATFQKDRLISLNSFKEEPGAKEYQRSYWLLEGGCEGDKRIIKFGSLSDLSKVIFTGHFDGKTLVSYQKIGAGTSYELTTTFGTDHSNTQGLFEYNGEMMQIDEMFYQRSGPDFF